MPRVSKAYQNEGGSTALDLDLLRIAYDGTDFDPKILSEMVRALARTQERS